MSKELRNVERMSVEHMLGHGCKVMDHDRALSQRHAHVLNLERQLFFASSGTREQQQHNENDTPKATPKNQTTCWLEKDSFKYKTFHHSPKNMKSKKCVRSMSCMTRSIVEQIELVTHF
jgi:hypothetical protein